MRPARLTVSTRVRVARAPHLVSVPAREVGLLCESCGELGRGRLTIRFARLCDDCADRARPHRHDHYDDLGGEA